MNRKEAKHTQVEIRGTYWYLYLLYIGKISIQMLYQYAVDISQAWPALYIDITNYIWQFCKSMHKMIWYNMVWQGDMMQYNTNQYDMIQYETKPFSK